MKKFTGFLVALVVGVTFASLVPDVTPGDKVPVTVNLMVFLILWIVVAVLFEAIHRYNVRQRDKRIQRAIDHEWQEHK